MPKKKRAKKRARSRAHPKGKYGVRGKHKVRGKSARSGKTHRRVRPASRSRISKKHREFLRQSKASKKGWRRRKAKEKIKERAKQKPTGKGKLREWIVNFSYFGAKTSRILGFTVIARNEQDALTFVYRAIANGKDSVGSDLTWVSKIDWSEVDVTTPIEDEEERLKQKEIKELGDGWVEVH